MLCPSCGAGVDDGLTDAVRCRHCGATRALDPAMRRNLVRHAWRTRRSEHKAQCILRQAIFAQLLPGLMSRARWYLWGGLAFVFLSLPFVFVGVEMISESDSPGAGLLGLVVIGLATIAVTIAFPLGLLLAFRAGKKADVVATRAARAAGALTDIAAPVRCPQCGGHARVVVIGAASANCPWCNARLVAASVDAATAAANAILVGQQQRVDEALVHARLHAGAPTRNRFQLQLPGFEFRGGVYDGFVHGLPAWIAFDATEAGVHRQVDIERDTRLEGAVWFVRREVQAMHGQHAAELGLPIPAPASVPELDSWFAIHAEPGVSAADVARLPSVRALLQRLSACGSVHVDPAGATVWNLGGPMLGGQQEVLAESDGVARAVMELA